MAGDIHILLAMMPMDPKRKMVSAALPAAEREALDGIQAVLQIIVRLWAHVQFVQSIVDSVDFLAVQEHACRVRILFESGDIEISTSHFDLCHEL